MDGCHPHQASLDHKSISIMNSLLYFEVAPGKGGKRGAHKLLLTVSSLGSVDTQAEAHLLGVQRQDAQVVEEARDGRELHLPQRRSRFV